LKAVGSVAVPWAVATETVTWPGAWARVLAVMRVLSVTVNVVAVVVPNFTEATVVKLAPVITTVVPPVVGPVAGVTEAMDGGPSKVKALVAVPAGVVTETLTAPAAWAGVLAFTVVALVTV
jgi:hypothetical protein